MALTRPGIQIALLVVLCLASIVFLLEKITVNQSSTLEQMLTDQDRNRIGLHRAAFATESEIVLVAINSIPVMQPARLVEIEQALLLLPGVQTTLSVASVPGLQTSLPSAKAKNTELLLVLLAPGSAHLDAAKTLSLAIRETIDGLLAADQSSSIVGLPQIREASWAIGERDVRQMLPLLVLVTLLVTQLCFKSFTAIGLSLLLTSMTTSVCLALQWLVRAELNALLVLVVPVIWTIATLDAFHLYSRTVIHARRNNINPARTASRELFLPCLLTTVTTAGCFLTLTLLDTSPLIVSFGIWCTAGTLLAFVLTFTLGTKLLSSHATQKDYPRWPASLAFSLVSYSQRHHSAVVLLWLAMLVGAVILVPRVELATSFPQIFTSGTSMAQEIEQLQQLTDSDLNPLEIVIKPTDAHGRQLESLGSAALLGSNYFKTISETRLVLPLDALADKDLESLLASWDTGEKQMGDEPFTGFRNWANTKEPAIRLQVFMDQTTYARKREIFGWLQNFDDTMLDHHSVSLSGSGYLYYLTEQRGLKSLLLSSILSLLILGATLWWIVRKPVQLLIVFCGSIVPAIILTGCMAAAGIPWTIAMLPMPVLLLGLMNDDTIHISWRARTHGNLRNRDFQCNAINAGPALLATTLVLSGAIATMVFSGIQTNQYLGALIPLGLLLAFLCNLTLLPALSSYLRKSTQ